MMKMKKEEVNNENKETTKQKMVLGSGINLISRDYYPCRLCYYNGKNTHG